MIYKVPESVQNLTKRYLNLNIGDKEVASPYFLNPKSQRFGLRVMIGKGTPEEIELETRIYAKLRDLDLTKLDEDGIRKFMKKIHIGIDCSGFVVHLLNAWLLGNKKKKIWKYLKYRKQNVYRRIARRLRPVENINVDLLTGKLNSDKINDLNKIQPGDLIRFNGLRDGFHIALIYEIEKKDQNIIRFKYVHSSKWYEDKHGVRFGEVLIKNPNGGLKDQDWTEEYKGRNWTYEELLKNYDDSGIRRLRDVPLDQSI